MKKKKHFIGWSMQVIQPVTGAKEEDEHMPFYRVQLDRLTSKTATDVLGDSAKLVC